jgi:hypothetical protein
MNFMNIILITNYQNSYSPWTSQLVKQLWFYYGSNIAHINQEVSVLWFAGHVQTDHSCCLVFAPSYF